MIELSKLIVFLFVSFLFMYMIWINHRVINKFISNKIISTAMVSGLGLTLAASFFDMISSLVHIEFKSLISICFAIGIGMFVTYLISWLNYIVKVMNTLNKNANSDTMTGLYNRKGFENVFKRKIGVKQPFYIMVFDLDKTKIINDNFGHLKGDKYIISAAKIIKDKIGKRGVVGRTGGDEFIALIDNMNIEEIENIKSSIKESVSHIFYKQNTQVSIGYSKYIEDGTTFTELLSIADKRMYEEKRNRKESFFNNRESII